MLARAGGKPIRVATQVDALPRAAARRSCARDPRFAGLMTYTLPETLWLAEHGFEDLLLAYPTADREALRELALRSVADPGRRADRDASTASSTWRRSSRCSAPTPRRSGSASTSTRAGGRSAGGSRSASSARRCTRSSRRWRFAREIEAPAADRTRRADGLRGADRRRRRPAAGHARCAAPRSASCSGARRAELARAAGARSSPRSASSASCEIVNGGGTGSLELTARRGRGHRGHRRLGLLRPRPLRPLQPLQPHPGGRASRCRSCASRRRASRPRSAAATSPPAPATPRACPAPGCRAGLQLDAEEGAGEVQTPLLGAAAVGLRGRRPRLPAPRQGGRALRALRRPPPGRRRARSSTSSPPTAARARRFL